MNRGKAAEDRKPRASAWVPPRRHAGVGGDVQAHVPASLPHRYPRGAAAFRDICHRNGNILRIIVQEVELRRRPDQSGFPVHPADPAQQEVSFIHHDPAGLAEEYFLVIGAHDGFVNQAQQAIEPAAAGRLLLGLLPIVHFLF